MILPVAVLVANLVCAEDAQYQDVHYTVDDNRLTAEVTLNPKASGELLIPETIVVGQNTYTVIAIGDKAFKGCKNLTAIVLPKTIERVYRSAFDGTGIMLKKENWKDGCLWIDSILIATDKTIKPRFVVPEGTRLIAAGAFQGNKALQRVELPSCISRIDHETFRDCKNLQKVVIPKTITSIGEDAFLGCGIYQNEKKWKKGALILDDCLVATNNDLPTCLLNISSRTRSLSALSRSGRSPTARTCAPSLSPRQSQPFPPLVSTNVRTSLTSRSLLRSAR